MRRDLVVLAALLAILPGSIPNAMAVPPPAVEVEPGVFEIEVTGQAAAEQLFAGADAAVWFPEERRVRWLAARGIRPDLLDAVSTFEATLDRDYPGFRSGERGQWLLKSPASMQLQPRSEQASVTPDAVAFSDSFESGLSNWDLDDNTLELYSWGTTACSYRTGARSADALRGGVNTLGCNDVYAPNVVTTMTHKSCESLAGATQAWLDVWIHVASESGKDKLGFYYDDSAGSGYGYTFSGSWSAWFHVAINLKQWFRVGDVTATSCPKITVAFESDATTQSGFGARVDDLALTTGTPSFLGCSIGASPASGIAPLKVNFTSTVSSTTGTSYLWSFGDAVNSTSTSANPSFTFTAPGEYRVRLRVDQAGIYSYAHKTIVVSSVAAHSSKRRALRQIGDAPLATKTIGSSGGTLTGGGATLTVPAGAFASDTELALARRRSAYVADGEVTDRYVLRGLPDTIARELTLELPLATGAAAPSGSEVYFVSMDAPAYIKSLPADRAAGMRRFRQRAGVSGSKLTARINSEWGSGVVATTGGALQADAHDPYVSEVQGEKFVPVETAHFSAWVRSARASSTRPILDMLEVHYDRIEDLGFSFACRNDSTGQFRRIEVVPKDFGIGGDLGAHVSKGSPCGAGWFFNDYLEITTSYPPTSTDVNWTAGHELFHLVQDVYSPGGAKANLWLKEATSIWYELANGNPCPTVQSANQRFAWNGLFNSQASAVEAFWTTDREARHGYGASYALWDRWHLLTDPFLQILWNGIRTGSSEVAALQSALGSTQVPDFWASFARNYFTGSVQGGCGVSWTGGGATFDVTKIADYNALPAAFKVPMYPLSARSWAVDLVKYSGSGITPVSLNASGLRENQSVYVYDVRSKAQVAELTKAAPTWSITNLNDYKGSVLVVIAVDRNLPGGNANSQEPTNEVTLTLAPAVSVFTVALWEVEGCGDIWQGGEYGLFYAKWNGSSFTWSETENSTDDRGKVREYHETITGTVSADRKTLNSFVYENQWKETYPADGGNCRVTAGCTVEGSRRIRLTFVGPAPDWSPTYAHYLLTGPEARAAIAEWVHREKQTNWSNGSDNYDCSYAIDETKPDKFKVEALVQ